MAQDGARMIAAIKRIAAKEAAAAARNSSRANAPVSRSSTNGDVLESSHGGQEAQFAHVEVVGDNYNKPMPAFAENSNDLNLEEIYGTTRVPGFFVGQTYVPPRDLRIEVHHGRNQSRKPKIRATFLKKTVTLMRGVDYVNLVGSYSVPTGYTYLPQKEKLKDEDKKGIDRLFGTKAYGAAKPTETITGGGES